MSIARRFAEPFSPPMVVSMPSLAFFPISSTRNSMLPSKAVVVAFATVQTWAFQPASATKSLALKIALLAAGDAVTSSGEPRQSHPSSSVKHFQPFMSTAGLISRSDSGRLTRYWSRPPKPIYQSRIHP